MWRIVHRSPGNGTPCQSTKIVSARPANASTVAALSRSSREMDKQLPYFGFRGLRDHCSQVVQASLFEPSLWRSPMSLKTESEPTVANEGSNAADQTTMLKPSFSASVRMRVRHAC